MSHKRTAASAFDDDSYDEFCRNPSAWNDYESVALRSVVERDMARDATESAWDSSSASATAIVGPVCMTVDAPEHTQLLAALIDVKRATDNMQKLVERLVEDGTQCARLPADLLDAPAVLNDQLFAACKMGVITAYQPDEVTELIPDVWYHTFELLFAGPLSATEKKWAQKVKLLHTLRLTCKLFRTLATRHVGSIYVPKNYKPKMFPEFERMANMFRHTYVFSLPTSLIATTRAHKRDTGLGQLLQTIVSATGLDRPVDQAATKHRVIRFYNASAARRVASQNVFYSMPSNSAPFVVLCGPTDPYLLTRIARTTPRSCRDFYADVGDGVVYQSAQRLLEGKMFPLHYAFFETIYFRLSERYVNKSWQLVERVDERKTTLKHVVFDNHINFFTTAFASCTSGGLEALAAGPSAEAPPASSSQSPMMLTPPLVSVMASFTEASPDPIGLPTPHVKDPPHIHVLVMDGKLSYGHALGRISERFMSVWGKRPRVTAHCYKSTPLTATTMTSLFGDFFGEPKFTVLRNLTELLQMEARTGAFRFDE